MSVVYSVLNREDQVAPCRSVLGYLSKVINGGGWWGVREQVVRLVKALLCFKSLVGEVVRTLAQDMACPAQAAAPDMGDDVEGG